MCCPNCTVSLGTQDIRSSVQFSNNLLERHVCGLIREVAEFYSAIDGRIAARTGYSGIDTYWLLFKTQKLLSYPHSCTTPTLYRSNRNNKVLVESTKASSSRSLPHQTSPEAEVQRSTSYETTLWLCSGSELPSESIIR